MEELPPERFQNTEPNCRCTSKPESLNASGFFTFTPLSLSMPWPTTSRQSRGYDADWNRVRLLVLRRDYGLCQCDQCQGGAIRLRVATEVHHVISKARGGTDAESNLIAISNDCHKRETAAEQGRTLKPKVRIGLDGWPAPAVK